LIHISYAEQRPARILIDAQCFRKLQGLELLGAMVESYLES
jgi:hypothetical protein